MNILSILLYYLLIINAAAYILFGIDKKKAKQGKWRVPEVRLLLLAAIGGSAGALLGMKIFHHKTLHKKFKWGIPFIIALQLFLAACIIIKYPIILITLT